MWGVDEGARSSDGQSLCGEVVVLLAGANGGEEVERDWRDVDSVGAYREASEAALVGELIYVRRPSLWSKACVDRRED